MSKLRESLREEFYREADSEAKRRKKEVDYIFDVIDNEPRLYELFGNDGLSPEALERMVFDHTRWLILTTDDGYCCPIGLNGTPYTPEYLKDNPEGTPEYITLGWVEVVKDTERDHSKIYPLLPSKKGYSLLVSEKGVSIVNGLRKVRGQLSAKEGWEQVIAEEKAASLPQPS